jgi:urea transport system ATP-binding protein
MLTIQKLSVAYGETLILRNVNLEVEPGKVVCLMGRNGVGKTTLLKTIMGLLQPVSGRIAFEGQTLTRTSIDVGAAMTWGVAMYLGRLQQYLSDSSIFRCHISPDKRARMGLGYVPQGREIFPQLTVLENLQIGMMANPERPKRVPEEVFEYFPALKTMLSRRGGFLSGGQQQQLAIARVLVAKPKLLILDEPTEGIQPNIITLIGKVLETLKKTGNVAVLLVEQYLEFATKLADEYYVMEKGSIVLNGSAHELDKELIKPYLAF